MNFEQLIVKLSSDSWADVVTDIEAELRQEMLGNKSIIRAIKESDEPNRKSALADKAKALSGLSTLDGLDEEIQKVTNSWLNINTVYANRLYVNFVNELNDFKDLKSYPKVEKTLRMISDTNQNADIRNRLTALLSKVINASLSQANKSNAGTAGETLVRSIFEAAGLKKNEHFREQYKSQAGGSDADFVFPNVDNYQDYNLEIVVAVQFSSNDRTRMSTSEMKSGVQNFAVTGNGLSASSKNLSSIGKEIIASLKTENVRMVCYDKEIKKELDRLEKKICKPKNEADLNEAKLRKEYFETLAISFEDFAKQLQARYITSTN